MEKLSDLLITAVGIIGGCIGFAMKRLFNSVDKANARIDILEHDLVSRAYLETQLAPIRQDLNLILSHLLEHRNTEGSLAGASPVKPIKKSS